MNHSQWHAVLLRGHVSIYLIVCDLPLKMVECEKLTRGIMSLARAQ